MKEIVIISNYHCLKKFVLGVYLVRIQSKCRKMRTRKTPALLTNTDTSYAVYVFVGNCLQTVIYCLPCSYKTQPKVTQVGWMVSIKLVLLWIDCGTCKRSVLQEIGTIHNCLECKLLSLEKLWIQMHQVATQLTLALIRVRNVKRQCPFEVTFKISHFL